MREHARAIYAKAGLTGRAAFGPERVMWGSDWPVCRLRGEYADWRAAALELTSGLSEVDRALVYGGTAAGFYGI